MARDVFFLDHRNAEESGGDDSASKTNTYEAKMIKDLVLYFLKQGKYTKTGDVVVLCAYLGQLAKVRKLLSSEVATVIDERDAVQLINRGDEDEAADILADSTEQVNVSKRVLLRTVDNFQGEEGTIVILSLVRNSGDTPMSKRKIGFLRSTNRANVALSRAREGLYILGNADDLLASGSKMWSGVIEQLRQNEQIGPAFPAIPMIRSIEPFVVLAHASSSAVEVIRVARPVRLPVVFVNILPTTDSLAATWARCD
ncbi:hypothetical protein FRC01_013906, partial [Tulasnella sp. 417]